MSASAAPSADAAARAARARAHVRGLYAMVDLPAPAATAAPDAPGGEAELVTRAARLGRALLDGGVRVLQLRMKHAEARALLAAAAPLRALCSERGALFVVNDRLDVALAAGADGVHLGQEDLPLPAARSIAPPYLLIGVSTHDEQQAARAAAEGADYLGFGPIFATRTKDNPDPVVGPARLAAVCRAVAVPVCAIGGIDLSTLPSVVSAGAAAAALIAAINLAPDVTAAALTAHAAFPKHSS